MIVADDDQTVRREGLDLGDCDTLICWVSALAIDCLEPLNQQVSCFLPGRVWADGTRSVPATFSCHDVKTRAGVIAATTFRAVPHFRDLWQGKLLLLFSAQIPEAFFEVSGRNAGLVHRIHLVAARFPGGSRNSPAREARGFRGRGWGSHE